MDFSPSQQAQKDGLKKEKQGATVIRRPATVHGIFSSLIPRDTIYSHSYAMKKLEERNQLNGSMNDRCMRRRRQHQP